MLVITRHSIKIRSSLFFNCIAHRSGDSIWSQFGEKEPPIDFLNDCKKRDQESDSEKEMHSQMQKHIFPDIQEAFKNIDKRLNETFKLPGIPAEVKGGNLLQEQLNQHLGGDIGNITGENIRTKERVEESRRSIQDILEGITINDRSSVTMKVVKNQENTVFKQFKREKNMKEWALNKHKDTLQKIKNQHIDMDARERRKLTIQEKLEKERQQLQEKNILQIDNENKSSERKKKAKMDKKHKLEEKEILQNMKQDFNQLKNVAVVDKKSTLIPPGIIPQEIIDRYNVQTTTKQPIRTFAIVIKDRMWERMMKTNRKYCKLLHKKLKNISKEEKKEKEEEKV